jgi:hypothetical protein
VGVGPTRSEAAVEPFGGPAFEPLISRGGSNPGSFTGKDPFRGIPLSRSLSQEIEKEEKKDTKSNDVAYLFWRGYYGEGEASPASPARSAACPAVELMRRGELLAGRPLRVREPFEERLFRFAFFKSRVRSGRSAGKRSRPGLYIPGRGSGDGSSLRFLPLPLGFRNPRDFSQRRGNRPSCPLRRHPFRFGDG